MDLLALRVILREWLGLAERGEAASPEQDYVDSVEALNALRSLFEAELARRTANRTDEQN